MSGIKKKKSPYISDTLEAIIKNSHSTPLPKRTVQSLQHTPRGYLETKTTPHTQIMTKLWPTAAVKPNMNERVIDNIKSTVATGSDCKFYKHLIDLGPTAIRLLTDIFNPSIQTTFNPKQRKTNKIFPVIKVTETTIKPVSYRPITLPCNPVKFLWESLSRKLVLTSHSPQRRKVK